MQISTVYRLFVKRQITVSSYVYAYLLLLMSMCVVSLTGLTVVNGCKAFKCSNTISNEIGINPEPIV